VNWNRIERRSEEKIKGGKEKERGKEERRQRRRRKEDTMSQLQTP
jgi:hypothetical protein